MRLTTWNVGMALRKKQAALATLRSDILILQEVSKADASAHAEYCWVGNKLTKGLAVVGSNGFRVRVHPAHDPRIEFVVPIEVTGPAEFLLLAVWVMHNRAVNRIQESPNRWQMLQALEAYEPLLQSQPCVVAGDFNNAVRWDGPRKASNHSLAVEKLSDFGLVSAYHTRSVASQGNEPDPTLFWMRHRGSPYHIDYIWLPQAWVSGLKAVEVGEFSTWVQSGLSDHVPLTVELDDAVIGRLTEAGATTTEEVLAPN
jgi:endonuclease/exonuclease/phosphatase family metal-dependent hydrolase